MISAPPHLKVCCIQSIDEARLAMRHGASAIGLVSRMPSGPGPIPEETIAAIAAAVGGRIDTFLLTCETAAEALVAQAKRCGCSTLQLVDAVEPRVLKTLRREIAHVRLVQVIHVRDEISIAEAKRIAPLVDAILLDSGNPKAAVKEFGGTGRVHDWSVSRRIVESVEKPVYLAGGLHPSNVAEAVKAVRPFGIDVCSGLRTDGKLDEAKLKAFAEAIANA